MVPLHRAAKIKDLQGKIAKLTLKLYRLMNPGRKLD